MKRSTFSLTPSKYKLHPKNYILQITGWNISHNDLLRNSNLPSMFFYLFWSILHDCDIYPETWTLKAPALRVPLPERLAPCPPKGRGRQPGHMPQRATEGQASRRRKEAMPFFWRLEPYWGSLKKCKVAEMETLSKRLRRKRVIRI